MNLSYLLLAVAMGGAVSIYIPMASQSAKIMGSPILGNVPFFAIAFFSSVVIALVSGYRFSDIERIRFVPSWLLLSGAVSSVMIIGASFLVPRLGTGLFFVLLVTGQIVLGAIIAQFGLLDTPQHPLTAMKVLGMISVIVGATLVSLDGKTN